MWWGIELRDIRAFLTLAEELHYGRTAERLGLTASRVSQTIRLLETRVGGKLFDRTSRRVSLTPLGEELLRGVGPAYEQMQRGYTDVHEMATGVAGTLRLGMNTPVNGGPHLVEIVKTFHERHPDCRVQLVETGFARDDLEWLKHDELDLLATRLPIDDPDVAIGPILSRDERVVLVAKDGPLANRKSVSYEELGEYTMPYAPSVRAAYMDAMAPPVTSSGRPITRIEARSPLEAVMRVAAGEVVHPTAASFLDHFPHPGVTAIPIRDLPPLQSALVWLKRNRRAKIDAFTRAATDTLEAETPAYGSAPAL